MSRLQLLAASYEKRFVHFLQTLYTSAKRAQYAVCMNKARYAKSRWWVAASALGAFVAMFGALFSRDRDAFDATDAIEAAAPVATPVTQQAPTTNRGARPTSTTQQSTRNVQPTGPRTQPATTTQPHTRTKAS